MHGHLQYRQSESFFSRASSASSENDSSISRTVSRANSAEGMYNVRLYHNNESCEGSKVLVGSLDQTAISHRDIQDLREAEETTAYLYSSVVSSGSQTGQSKLWRDWQTQQKQFHCLDLKTNSASGAIRQPNSFVDDFLAREDCCASSINDFFARERSAGNPGPFICDTLDLLGISIPSDQVEAMPHLNETPCQTRPPSLVTSNVRRTNSSPPQIQQHSSQALGSFFHDCTPVVQRAESLSSGFFSSLNQSAPGVTNNPGSYLTSAAFPSRGKRERETIGILRGQISDDERRDRRRAQNREAQQRLRRRRRDPASAGAAAPSNQKAAAQAPSGASDKPLAPARVSAAAQPAGVEIGSTPPPKVEAEAA